MASYWIDTLVLKTEGNTYATLAASPSPLRGKPTLAQDVARRISGPVAGEVFAKVKTYQVPITNSSPAHYIICHLPLVFLSPTSPLLFYSPSLSQSPLFCLSFCLLVSPCAFYMLASSLGENLLIWIHLKCSTWIIFYPYALVLKPQLA